MRAFVITRRRAIGRDHPRSPSSCPSSSPTGPCRRLSAAARSTWPSWPTSATARCRTRRTCAPCPSPRMRSWPAPSRPAPRSRVTSRAARRAVGARRHRAVERHIGAAAARARGLRAARRAACQPRGAALRGQPRPRGHGPADVRARIRAGGRRAPALPPAGASCWSCTARTRSAAGPSRSCSLGAHIAAAKSFDSRSATFRLPNLDTIPPSAPGSYTQGTRPADSPGRVRLAAPPTRSRHQRVGDELAIGLGLGADATGIDGLQATRAITSAPPVHARRDRAHHLRVRRSTPSGRCGRARPASCSRTSTCPICWPPCAW